MKYSKTHEWIDVQNGIGTVGITEYAQQELGEIVYVELPQVNRHVKLGDEAVVLESTKAASDIYTPVSGKIVEVNTDLANAPEKINTSPESSGWLFKILLADLKELDSLLERDTYLKINHP